MNPTPTRIVSRDALRLAQRSGMQVGHAVTVTRAGAPSEPMGWVASCSCGRTAASSTSSLDALRQLAGHEEGAA